MTALGMVDAANNIKNNGGGTLWDYLAFVPAVGYAAGRAGRAAGWLNGACFVGETRVAVGWDPESLVVTTAEVDALAGGEEWSGESIVAGSVLLGVALAGRQRSRRVRRVLGRVVRSGSTRLGVLPTGARRRENSSCEGGRVMEDIGIDEVFARRGGWESPQEAVGDQPEPVPLRESSREEEPRRSRAWLWLAPLMLALGCLWQGLPGSVREGASSAVEPRAVQAASVDSRESSGPTLRTRRIDEIRPGMRVLAQHPDSSENAKPDVEIVPAANRLVSLVMPKPDGGTLEIRTIWPASTLCEYGVSVGAVIHADPSEIETTGDALVTRIEPCPEIERGPGRIVTTTFKHSAANIVDISLARDAAHPPETIGTTGNHPFWSEDRQTFVSAEELRDGERLRRADATIATVADTTRRRVGEPVYNLEVDAEHVYHVGVGGVLVHNTGTQACFGSAAFGSAVHGNFLSRLQAGGLRGTVQHNRTGPGHTGIDLTFRNTAYFPGVAQGFRHAELKPDSWSGLATFQRQLSTWRGTGTRGNVALFTYDAAGNITFAGIF
jgi:hypothetical protein